MDTIAFLEADTGGNGYRAFAVARQQGFRVMLITRDLEFYRSRMVAAAALQYVDEVVQCETNDAEATLEAMRAVTRHRPLTGLLSFSEYYIATAAYVAGALGLPGTNPSAARRAHDKRATRRACTAREVPVPRFELVTTPTEAMEAARDRIGFPCIVKPSDLGGSQLVALCEDTATVYEQALAIEAYETNQRGQRRTQQVLVEEYMIGHEVSVEVIVTPSGPIVMGVTDKTVAPGPYFVEIGHAFPSCFPPEDLARCEAVALAALEAIGFEFGVAHIELKLTADGPHLIEINGRAAGDHIVELVEHSLGVSVIGEILKLHTGRAVSLPAKPTAGASIRFVTGPAGVVKDVAGLDRARAIRGVAKAVVTVRPGDRCPVMRNSDGRLGYVVTVAPSSAMARCLAEDAAREITLTLVEEEG